MLSDRRFLRLLFIVLVFALTSLIFSNFFPINVSSKRFSDFLPGTSKQSSIPAVSQQPEKVQNNSLLWDTSLLPNPTSTISRTNTATTAVATPGPSINADGGKWVFQPARDAQDYGLGEEQCSSAFGPLFSELDRAVAYRRKAGNITVEDLDISWSEGAIRAMIYDRQVSQFCHPQHHHFQS